MAGGAVKFRQLSRTSAHRQALLRNLVTSLFKHESISTTWPKAKEAQRLAEKLVTLGKKNTEASRRRAHQIFFTPLEVVPKLFSTIRERYASRPGGYTRVLRIEPMKNDQAPSAILELVDGPRDMRFAMTAQTIARETALNRPKHPMTLANEAKVTRFRPGGKEKLEAMVQKFKDVQKFKQQDRTSVTKKNVYRGPRPDRMYPGRELPPLISETKTAGIFGPRVV